MVGSDMSTDARELAARYYAAGCRDMAEDAAALGAHPQSLVILMPELVVLAKQVCSDQPDTWEELHHIAEQPDAWYIHLMTGDLHLLRRIAAALPLRPYVCFRRGLRSPHPHRVLMKRLLREPHTPSHH